MNSEVANMLKEIDIKTLKNYFSTDLKDQWALISAGTKDDCNTMTINWGGIGYLWHKYVFFAFVRPTRYTYKFTEEHDTFTISFYGNEYKKELGYLGTISGRDENKIKKCGFHVIPVDGTVTFEEAEVTYVCRKVYNDLIDPKFLDHEIDKKNYQNDYHKMYIGEIIRVYKKD